MVSYMGELSFVSLKLPRHLHTKPGMPYLWVYRHAGCMFRRTCAFSRVFIILRICAFLGVPCRTQWPGSGSQNHQLGPPGGHLHYHRSQHYAQMRLKFTVFFSPTLPARWKTTPGGGSPESAACGGVDPASDRHRQFFRGFWWVSRWGGHATRAPGP